MSITNSSAARRAGFKLNNKSVHPDAAIDMSKIGCRTLRLGLPAPAWVGIGTSVALAEDGVFPVFLLPDANSGNLYGSFKLPAEWVSGTDLVVNIYWKTSDISGDVEFSVALASITTGEATTATDTQVVATTVNATANKLNKSSVTFAAALFAAGDIVGINILRNPADAQDTLGSDINFVYAEVEFTGRG